MGSGIFNPLIPEFLNPSIPKSLDLYPLIFRLQPRTSNLTRLYDNSEPVKITPNLFTKLSANWICEGEMILEDNLLLVEKKNNVCTLALNRPGKQNSLSPELIDRLLYTLEALSNDADVCTVVLRGAGDKAFCAGYDIKSLPTRSGGDVKEAMKTVSPVESLLMCCDICIGADDIRMGMPPAKLGLVYPWTGLQRFIQTIGLRSTRELFFSGRFYEGLRLKEFGLVNYLVPRKELETITYNLAEEIAGNAPLALKGTKRILNILLQSNRMDHENQIEAESIIEAAFNSQDLKEGQTAFLEKRKPKFKGE
jgi:enoyl-CoA hydratase/carnithine racemase